MFQKMDAMFLYGKMWTANKIRDFLVKEDGDVNIVSIVVIIGIVIIVAALFRGRLEQLIGKIFDTLDQKAVEAVGGTP